MAYTATLDGAKSHWVQLDGRKVLKLVHQITGATTTAGTPEAMTLTYATYLTAGTVANSTTDVYPAPAMVVSHCGGVSATGGVKAATGAMAAFHTPDNDDTTNGTISVSLSEELDNAWATQDLVTYLWFSQLGDGVDNGYVTTS